MAKNFAPRVSKRQRKVIDMSDKLSRDLFQLSDERLLKGAKLDEIKLKDIYVKEQVRTKFNDSSIKELAANIKVNGLIQPLVLHRDSTGKMTLICGERRFRAMSSIDMEKCPCFILDNKSEEELMAIQFSENSSREALHYIDKADGILNYQKATKASERKIQAALGISKSEVHRSLLIAKMPKKLKEAAKEFNIEKYVLLEFDALDKGAFKTSMQKKILAGEVTKRSQLKKAIKTGVVSAGTAKKKVTKKKAMPKGLTAAAFLKAMQSKQKDMNLDKETKKLLKTLVEETKEIVDL
ncbi:ParB/RepB/Spo0J family partition protein [Halobacteriovorax sp. GB3]|uniref:ParB/RepB/Spo0J family partition protein n=1 Tax=Halobacteriovorax sp. GB3 TaxID=2719615 RepID=UPI002361A914|nr:ParB/RepB/Spo0J family partition protein [Halobacteriovorax sp. GB3]MDD0854259.1 ParB/RepB/Spo0J family partition protein [Halobacteriovorax sp. GB3]